VGPYTADFYCAAALLVVEADGEAHIGREARDGARDEYFRQLGLVVLRFWNTQIYDEQDAVVEHVFRVCSERVAALPPHSRHAGARNWKRPRREGQPPSPGSLRSPPSPPGERVPDGAGG